MNKLTSSLRSINTLMQMPFCDSTVNIIFKNKDNSIQKVKAKIGQNLLAIAHENDIDLEGLILDSAYYGNFY